MVADAERLRSSSMSPLARAALMRALTLRFGVLLTPAFWTTPIKRDLILADDSSADSWSATPADAPEVPAPDDADDAEAAGEARAREEEEEEDSP